jgi:3-oxoacyl-[acyl-carrier-protein] synthase-3
MTEVFIDHLSYAVGEDQQSLEQAAACDRTISAVEHLRDAGFCRHFVSRAETTAYDLARRCVEGISAGLSGTGAVVYATCLPQNANMGSMERFTQSRDVKHLMDYAGSRLQAEFGLDEAIVIGIAQQACTGMLGAINVARMLLKTEPEILQALCVTADRFPAGALYEQAYNLISDGAAACILSRRPGGFRIVATHALTNGAMSGASDGETAGFYFNYTCRSIDAVLQRAGRGIGDIAWIVPQNTHRKAWQILPRILGIASHRVFAPTLPQIGHMISGDNVANLKQLDDARLVRSGELVLLTMAGYGLNWQSMILEKV